MSMDAERPPARTSQEPDEFNDHLRSMLVAALEDLMMDEGSRSEIREFLDAYKARANLAWLSESRKSDGLRRALDYALTSCACARSVPLSARQCRDIRIGEEDNAALVAAIKDLTNRNDFLDRFRVSVEIAGLKCVDASSLKKHSARALRSYAAFRDRGTVAD
jgi:hypothetical protein